MLKKIHHVQLAMPIGQEQLAATFYRDALGFVVEPKPPKLAARGGIWFCCDGIHLHLGVETPFRPAKKAHPAFECAEIAALAERLERAAFKVQWDDALPGYRRFFTHDPFGNRIEIMEPTA